MTNIIATVNCINGTCEHAEHKANMLLWVLPVIALTYIVYKYKHGNQDKNKI